MSINLHIICTLAVSFAALNCCCDFFSVFQCAIIDVRYLPSLAPRLFQPLQKRVHYTYVHESELTSLLCARVSFYDLSEMDYWVLSSSIVVWWIENARKRTVSRALKKCTWMSLRPFMHHYLLRFISSTSQTVHMATEHENVVNKKTPQRTALDCWPC